MLDRDLEPPCEAEFCDLECIVDDLFNEPTEREWARIEDRYERRIYGEEKPTRSKSCLYKC